MNWNGPWPRSSKSQATPAPLYLLPEGELTSYYGCRTIGAHKSQATKEATTPARYCSSHHCNRSLHLFDSNTEDAFVAFLDGTETLPRAEGTSQGKGKSEKKPRSDHGILASFNYSADLKPKRVEGMEDSATLGDQSMAKEAVIDDHDLTRLSIRSERLVWSVQNIPKVNGSVGGEKGNADLFEETKEMLERRKERENKEEEREHVTRTARRGVAFGFVVEDGGDGGDGKEMRRKCEAMMPGKVVEPSFAKDDWRIR
ncbi:hypothetical protein CC78DRAFT_562741 [Lojkania enalia]|uniref:Uncharacterized protein n=1 Tax=Lojkania enalia TaxID=147567 RepID=A0A9P4JZH1_9PLEO|nr:hypothetical protein CC78DRAFT_562741 [Didymosphaeria enalia]